MYSQKLNPYAGMDTNWYPYLIIVAVSFVLVDLNYFFENKK